MFSCKFPLYHASRDFISIDLDLDLDVDLDVDQTTRRSNRPGARDYARSTKRIWGRVRKCLQREGDGPGL